MYSYRGHHIKKKSVNVRHRSQDATQRKTKLTPKTGARINITSLPTKMSTTRHKDRKVLRAKALLKIIEKTGLDTGILYTDSRFENGTGVITVVNRALELVTAATEKKLEKSVDLESRAIARAFESFTLKEPLNHKRRVASSITAC